MKNPSKNVTKHDLVLETSKSSGHNQMKTKAVVEEFFRAVTRQMAKGQTIEIRGFGTFYIKERKPRPARNPRTGEVCPLDRRIVPLLKYSSEIRDHIKEFPELEHVYEQQEQETEALPQES